MKSFFVAVVLNGILFSTIFAQHKNDFILRGFISGKDTGKLYLRYSYRNKLVIDSSEIKNGKFAFKGLLDEPAKAELSDKKKLFSDGNENYVSDLYIEPTEMNISLVNKRFVNARLQGSKTDDDYKLLYNELNPVLDNISRLQNEMKLSNQKNTLLTDSLVIYNDKFKEISMHFIRNHTNSYIAVKAIQGLSIYEKVEPDSCLILLSSLSAEINNYHTTQRSKEAFIAESTSVPGHLSRDFIRKDVKGKIIKLSSFKGKYVLLDFWASWCIPCRKLTKSIKNIYSKYSSKGLVVMAISCDSKYEAWHNAIRTDGIRSFINILSFTDIDMNFLKTHDKVGDASFEGELRKQFNLMPIPAEILIDKEGIILGRYGATEKQTLDMLDKKLTEIFNGFKKP